MAVTLLNQLPRARAAVAVAAADPKRPCCAIYGRVHLTQPLHRHATRTSCPYCWSCAAPAMHGGGRPAQQPSSQARPSPCLPAGSTGWILALSQQGWGSKVLIILRFRAGIRPPHHPPDYFITGLEPS
eukprot:COSAG01_NODE_113_length_25617_cov_10.523492_21_plen_128_part_00